MSSPWILPLLLLFAVASAGPLELQADDDALVHGPGLSPPSLAAAAAAATTAAPAATPVEEQAVPAATLAPPADGQYCTVGGAVFHNGARLPTSADPDPCRACYCQGGEAVCARVHCYRRPDCAPRHVPGSCCPKYDNCPPAPEDRGTGQRVKDASTQTDISSEPTATQDATTTTTTTTSSTTVTTTDSSTAYETTSETNTEAGSTETAGSELPTSTAMPTTTTAATTTTAVTQTETTSTATASTTEAGDHDDEEEEEASQESATSSYPPGIDLHALHEHLPFLSPGDANGPNT